MKCSNKEKTLVGFLKENKTLVIISLSVIGVYFLSWVLISCIIVNKEERGWFGDQFGAVNALFSALAFLGLIITLLMQKEELELQRDELKQTREELENQRKEFELQNLTLKRQQFENALYNMLQLQQQIVNDLEYDSSVAGYSNTMARGGAQVKISGRELFRFSFEQLRHSCKGEDNIRQTGNGMRDVLKICGLDAYSSYTTATYFDHYFRHLYRIIKFIDSNVDLSFEEKYRYVGNVRGTLSRYELVWIYYNILANPSYCEFKRLIEKYALLKNLNESFLSFSKENDILARRIGKKKLNENGFSGSDYEFFLNDKPGDPNKFYVGAFYNEQNIELGLIQFRKIKEILES